MNWLSDVFGNLGRALLVAPAAGLVAALLFFLASRTYAADRARVEQVDLVRE